MRLTFLTLGLAALTPAAALADACETVKAAYDKLAVTSAFAQTVAMQGRPAMRMVTLGDMLYLDAGDGAWSKMPMQAGMRAQMMASVLPDAAALQGCTALGAETLDGADMTVIEYTPPAIGGMAMGRQKVWIGADGLPHRMTMESDDKPMEVTIVYDGVTAPVE